MKKIILCLVAVFFLMTVAFSAYADFKNPPIVDDACCLAGNEREKLSEKLDEIRKKYNFDVVIYTQEQLSSDTVEVSAEEVYEQGGFGAGEESDGIMLYFCPGVGEYHLVTHGRGLALFNSNSLAYIESKVVSHLSNGDYYEAFKAYIIETNELLKIAEPDTTAKKEYSNEYLIYVIIGVLVFALIGVIILIKHKRKEKEG